MGKEVKIGLAVLSVLLVIFGVVLATRLMEVRERPDESSTAALTDETSGETAQLLPSTVQPTLLETSASDGKPPYSQMSSPATPADRRESRLSDRDDVVPGSSFMPKHDALQPVRDEHLAARGQTFVSSDRYIVEPEPAIDQGAPQRGEANHEIPDASRLAAATNFDSVEAPLPPRELAPVNENVPAANEVVATALSASSTAEVSDMAEYRAPRRDFYGASDAPTPTAAAPIPSIDASEHQAPAAKSTITDTTTQVVERSPISDYAPAAREAVVEMQQNTGTYYVEPGDSFWKISQKMYGVGGYFKALQEHNRARFPRPGDLNVGDEIATPSVEELHADYSGLCPKERTTRPGTPRVRAVSTLQTGPTYVVEEGDTLYDIAKYELGDGQRWPEIFALNQQTLSDDVDYLRPGTQLVLPASPEQQVDILTRQPGSTRSR